VKKDLNEVSEEASPMGETPDEVEEDVFSIRQLIKDKVCNKRALAATTFPSDNYRILISYIL
jgi:hypothetical protein